MMYKAKVAVCSDIRTKHSTQSERDVEFLNFNLSKTKRNLLSALYKESVRTAQWTLPTTVIKTNQLLMYKAKVAVCSDIRTKQSTQSERHVEFLNVKPGGT